MSLVAQLPQSMSWPKCAAPLAFRQVGACYSAPPPSYPCLAFSHSSGSFHSSCLCLSNSFQSPNSGGASPLLIPFLSFSSPFSLPSHPISPPPFHSLPARRTSLHTNARVVSSPPPTPSPPPPSLASPSLSRASSSSKQCSILLSTTSDVLYT